VPAGLEQDSHDLARLTGILFILKNPVNPVSAVAPVNRALPCVLTYLQQDLHDFAGLTGILFILKNPVNPVSAEFQSTRACWSGTGFTGSANPAASCSYAVGLSNLFLWKLDTWRTEGAKYNDYARIRANGRGRLR
jgi:hypothetical protein